VVATVALEHSGDGRNWVEKAGLFTASLDGASTYSAAASDDGSIPTLGFARVKITLGGTSPSAHCKIHVTGRDSAG
jgi:hypothetical protein